MIFVEKDSDFERDERNIMKHIKRIGLNNGYEVREKIWTLRQKNNYAVGLCMFFYKQIKKLWILALHLIVLRELFT